MVQVCSKASRFGTFCIEDFQIRDTRLLKSLLVSPNPQTSENWSLSYRCSSSTNMRFSFVFKTISCLELLILLPQPPERWDHRSVSAQPVSHIHVPTHRYQTHTCQQAKYLSCPSVSFQSQEAAVFVSTVDALTWDDESHRQPSVRRVSLLFMGRLC